VIWSQVRGIGWVFHFSSQFLVQKLLHRGCPLSWSTVMMENPVIWPKFKPFLHTTSHKLLQYFHIISLVDLNAPDSAPHNIFISSMRSCMTTSFMTFRILATLYATQKHLTVSGLSLRERCMSVTCILS